MSNVVPRTPWSPSTPEIQDFPRPGSHSGADEKSISPSPSSPFLPQDSPHARPARTASTGSFVSSPLNPTSPAYSNPGSFARRSDSRASTAHLTKFTSSDTHAALAASSSSGGRGSMILYRFAGESDNLLPPSKTPRDSTFSTHDSFIGFIPYVYDPEVDDGPPDDEDLLHDPNQTGEHKGRSGGFPLRGFLNVGVLLLLIAALLCLFVFYPVFKHFQSLAFHEAIDGNINVNGTGLIDTDTPNSAKTRKGYDGEDYDLVFSDEFNVDGRTFYPGDDPFWEAVDLWYGATADLEWYDPQQVSTRNGSLVITMDSANTLQSGLTSGSTAPFTVDQNHNLTYRSGMLQSWNKFCFTSGYIEVSMTLPGPDQNTRGYWPGAWTMGNLARPGYSATTDGMWPYTYNECDIGTFPNQTLKDKSGPPAALHSDQSRAKYNFELSWLTGQRSRTACSCPGSDHPGPDVTKGRGAPEIDILEAEKDKDSPIGQVVSQSAQFAPFSHDYFYGNTTADMWDVYTPDRTRPNSYKGSAVQQAISGLVETPSDIFQGSPNKRFATFGFEYLANPSSPLDGWITWQVDGSASHRLGAVAVGPDTGPTGSGVGQRLIPEEPMSIILNLGMSQNWQTIDLTTMVFPAEMLVDYVRVYQRRGQSNVGCDPKDYPTANYINNHLSAFQDVNQTTWQWEKPKNSLVGALPLFYSREFTVSQFDGC
ncbi:beta-glucan synthesis-associated protein-domain-containing protein [Infundibulicybe gibba]|nr:beta-glucan synthesis-associated protein-domain-containing protein [Infundibulicybe gibba]